LSTSGSANAKLGFASASRTPQVPGPNVTEQPQNQNACKHSRTRVIAEDNDARYLECLDCGAILEAGELQKENPAFGESLSDA
jgi:hypothetical protein